MKFQFLVTALGLALLVLNLGSSNAFAGGSGFVGNGGDAVAIDRQLFLRDLWNQNNASHPYIGASIDPSLPALPNQASMPFDFPRDLLARKLTDLNQACPGLGDFVLASMKNYTWVLVDYPLTPILDPDDPVEIPDAAALVQIANRFGATIRIQSASFAKLAASNQIALLIHEAVFSLVTPIARGDGLFEQPSYVAREITGSLFNASFLAKAPDVILAALSGLQIPHELMPLKWIRQPPEFTFSYGYFSSVTNQEFTLGQVSVDFSVKRSYASLKTTVTETCQKVMRTRSHLTGIKDLWISSDYLKRPIILQTHSYLAAPGVNQISVSIGQQPSTAGGSFYVLKDVLACTDHFDIDLDSIIAGNWDY